MPYIIEFPTLDDAQAAAEDIRLRTRVIVAITEAPRAAQPRRRAPRYIAVLCPWCRGDHWHVKRNILTSRAVPVVSAFTSRTEAEAEAARLSSAWEAR